LEQCDIEIVIIEKLEDINRDVYENIGENTQLIIAIHSPHIIGDIESKQLRVIKKKMVL